MGNTIRRQPITNNIPAAPDYQFLNVLNFNGLNMTDNPFTADVTTASDCLNVYVDEVGALTTRPRLDLFYDLKNHISDRENLVECFGIYPLSIGYLFHYATISKEATEFTSPTRHFDIVYDVNGYLSFVHVDTSLVNPDSTKLSVFEQDDKIYILSGEGYYFITYVVLDDTIVRAEIDSVEGYIPTTRVGRNKRIYDDAGHTIIDIAGTSFEDVNIVSNKYKETYFWDGKRPIEDVVDGKDFIVNNGYINTNTINTDKYQILKILTPEDSTSDKLTMVKRLSDNAQGTIIMNDRSGFLDDSFSLLPTPSVADVSAYDKLYYDMTPDGENIVCLISSFNTKGVYLYKSSESKWYSLLTNSSDTFTDSERRKYSRIKISNNGNRVVSYSHTKVLLWDYDADSDAYVMKEEALQDINEHTQLVGLVGSSDLTTFILARSQGDYLRLSGVYEYKNISDKLTGSWSSEKLWDVGLSSDGKVCVKSLYDEKTMKVYRDYTSSDEYDLMTSFNTKFYLPDEQGAAGAYGRNFIQLSADGTKIWAAYSSYKTPATSSYIVSWIDLSDVSNKEVKVIESDLTGWNALNYKQGSLLYATDIEFYIPSVEFFTNAIVRKISFDKTSIYPLLEITKNLSDDKVDSLRANFITSLLTTRFNNERWFATGSTLYYTANNDPSYIPVQNRNVLGEEDEKITGFNLADDSTLIVYKDNRVHAVSYGEISDNLYSYLYSDSPNTVGNNATGGSIVSILTEIPLQISYDGIYALRQLTNVQSSGRISELISERINKKWLLEDKEIIKNCKTINRLYWTYFILSEDVMSKIYLLDNRTGSWYYWEFPISILNAFVKNNTTYFSDAEGNLYTLKTSDIINKYNQNKTEYYDYGEKLIKWTWKSQILPMKTINYSKKLISTTFIMSDTDENDQYGLNYKFKAFRKTASQTQETTLSNNINYIVSTTKRTLVPRYNFMQIELSNIEDDLNNNKLRLIGLAFKYVLLEGMI